MKPEEGLTPLLLYFFSSTTPTVPSRLEERERNLPPSHLELRDVRPSSTLTQVWTVTTSGDTNSAAATVSNKSGGAGKETL
jgi:hypothetical protein